MTIQQMNRMDKVTAEMVAAALAAGWTIDTVLLYDEEGVEGFVWHSPDGREYYSPAIDGDRACGPEVPDEVRAALNRAAE